MMPVTEAATGLRDQIVAQRGEKSKRIQRHEQIKLLSDDNQVVTIPRTLAEYSQVLSMLLDDENGFLEAESGEVRLLGINGQLMGRLVEYLQYRRQYDGAEDHPPWDIAAEEAVDMLLMADYLDV